MSAIMNAADWPIGRMIKALEPCVLDIGARGGADEELLPIAWASRMVCFEPEASEAERLTQEGDSRWRKFEVLSFAVGGTSGSQLFHMPDEPQAASLLRHNDSMIERFGRPHLHRTRQALPVRTWTLDELRLSGHVDRVDYMKIDVEGAELDILKAGTSVLDECVALKVEVSFLEQRTGQPLAWEVARYLLDAGFEVVELHDIHRWRRRNLPAHPYRAACPVPYSRGQIAQCDLIALKAPTHVNGEAQALRLVSLAAVFGFFDYAITVLRTHPQLERRVKLDYDFALDAELGKWSMASGSREVKRAMWISARRMVPLFRAWMGRLPYSRGGVPY